jgi:hypothetical protein
MYAYHKEGLNGPLPVGLRSPNHLFTCRATEQSKVLLIFTKIKQQHKTQCYLWTCTDGLIEHPVHTRHEKVAPNIAESVVSRELSYIAGGGLMLQGKWNQQLKLKLN